jgi:hypothetical protein
MVYGLVDFWKSLSKRVKVTLTAVGVYNWGQQLTAQYNQLYAIDLGTTAVQLGFLNSVTAAISALVARARVGQRKGIKLKGLWSWGFLYH